MTIQLVICLGYVWGMCGSINTSTQPSMEACEKQAAAVRQSPKVIYAICEPKK